MVLFHQLSRRSFFALIGGAALFAGLPGIAKASVAPRFYKDAAAWEAIETGGAGNAVLHITGHVKKIAATEYVISRARYHCDYCYTGHPASILKIASAAAEGLQTLQGRVAAGRFVCTAA
jgi:hypothetical protein